MIRLSQCAQNNHVSFASTRLIISSLSNSERDYQTFYKTRILWLNFDLKQNISNWLEEEMRDNLNDWHELLTMFASYTVCALKRNAKCRY